MAKKIRQEQVVDLKENLTALGDKQVTAISFTGTTTKTLTITFEGGHTITSTFTDNNTTYNELTASMLNAGTNQTAGIISAKILVDYINSRLGAVMTYKGQKANYSDLPSSGNKTGDVWNIINASPANNVKAGDNVAWNGSAWDVMSGTIDTSAFLTEETDPKGVDAIAITGTTNKTITITLRDGSTITGNFTDNDTTYAKGTLVELNAGTSTTGKVWAAKDLEDFVTAMIAALEIEVVQEEYNIVSGNIQSGKVVLTLVRPDIERMKTMVFLNGVKQPYGSIGDITGTTMEILQNSLPTPIIVGDEVEIFYINN